MLEKFSNIVCEKPRTGYFSDKQQALLDTLNVNYLEKYIEHSRTASGYRYYRYNRKNAPNNSPKVIVKNNLVYFFCPFCNSIHSIQIANYPGLPQTNFSDVAVLKNVWFWNEDVIKPTFASCIHMDKHNNCVLNIQSGLIFSNSSISEKVLDRLKGKATFDYKLLAGTNQEKIVPSMLPMLSIDKWPVKMV
jgi:hypothetical protein